MDIVGDDAIRGDRSGTTAKDDPDTSARSSQQKEGEPNHD
jgi:hypothetical protein